MNWPKLKPREFRFLLITMAVVFITLNYMLILPWWRSSREYSRKIGSNAAEIARRVQVLESVESMRKERSRLTQNRETVSPDVENQEVWMKHFETLKNQSGVQLPYRRPKVEKGKLKVECTLQGSLESIVKLMYSLSSDASHPHIEFCHLSSPKEKEDQLNGQLTITVSLKSK